MATGRRIGPLAARAALSGFSLHYLDPFAFDAIGADLRPTLSTWAGGFSVSAQPVLTLGRWSTELLEGELAVGGGELRLERLIGPVNAAVSGSALNVANGATTGAFFRGTAEAVHTRGRWTTAVRLQGQRTPLETDLGGGITVAGTVSSGVQLHVEAARTLRDPLFGTRGTLALSAGLAVRPVRWAPPPPAPPVMVGEALEEGRRRVTFTLRAPEAREVALIGDFSGWEPVPMERTREGWRLERLLPPGLHHFGFIVDGMWALPPDVPGLVDDGWGRKNASVVVEP